MMPRFRGTRYGVTGRTAAAAVSDAPADPSTVSGLGLWLEDLYTGDLFQDSARTTPAVNGDPVGGWTDRSGAGRHASSSSTARPILRSGTAADGLQFDNSNDYLDLASAVTLAAAASTIYIVYYWPSATYVGTAMVDNPTETAKFGLLYQTVGSKMLLSFVDSGGSGSVSTDNGAVSAGYVVYRLRKTTSTNLAVKCGGASEKNITIGNRTSNFNRINIAGFAATNGRFRAAYVWPSKTLTTEEMEVPEDWIDYRYGARP